MLYSLLFWSDGPSDVIRLLLDVRLKKNRGTPRGVAGGNENNAEQ